MTDWTSTDITTYSSHAPKETRKSLEDRISELELVIKVLVERLPEDERKAVTSLIELAREEHDREVVEDANKRLMKQLEDAVTQCPPVGSYTDHAFHEEPLERTGDQRSIWDRLFGRDRRR